MKKADRHAAISLPLIILAGMGLAWAGSQGSAMIAGLPLFGLIVGLAFLIQWLAFVPAYIRQTERFFDVTGSLTHIFISLFAVGLSPAADGRSYLLLALVVIWAARLGAFLQQRIHKAGGDGRFADIKPSWVRFLSVWTIQGLWVSLTQAAALVAMTTTLRQELGLFALVGFLLWAIGFAIEVTADTQKKRFRENPHNQDKFIQSGLWARSRHPNYFGEIVLWIGVVFIALPVLRGWQWIALLSPLFVILLLTRVSGIPILEKRADEKWGGQPDYEAYKKTTPLLIPRL